jgi:hypothetical protein
LTFTLKVDIFYISTLVAKISMLEAIMTSIVKCKSGKYTYLYESTSYRDANGKPRCIRKCIGRIDPTTGKEIFHGDYIERTIGTDRQPNLTQNKMYSHDDIKFKSHHKEYGVTYLFNHLANSIGLVDTLQTVFPENWYSILALANYMAAGGEAMMYAKFWQHKNDLNLPEELTSQNISRLMVSITDQDRLLFYKK